MTIEEDAVDQIKVIFFAGCPSTETLLAGLEEIREKEAFEILQEKIYRAEEAREKGLYGSPTVLLNGQEFQGHRRGTAGVY